MLMAVFSLTLVVIVVSIIRVAVVNTTTKNPSISWLYLWSSIEMATCGCSRLLLEILTLTLSPSYKQSSLPALHHFVNCSSPAGVGSRVEQGKTLRLAVCIRSFGLSVILLEGPSSDPQNSNPAARQGGPLRLTGEIVRATLVTEPSYPLIVSTSAIICT